MRIKLILTILILFHIEINYAQGDGPRSFLLAPKGIWGINPKYLYLNQNLTPSGNILVKNADFTINVLPTTFLHTFSIGGNYARVFAMASPGWVNATLEANSATKIKAKGFSDGFIGLNMGILGAPALTPVEFVQHKIGFSLFGQARIWYPGSYDKNEIINLGTNRWTFEIGTPMAIPFHKDIKEKATWLEMYPRILFFTDNNNYQGVKIEQKPLFMWENHLTHNFSQKFWAGVDLTGQYGGRTIEGGIKNDNINKILGGGVNCGYQFTPSLSANSSFGLFLAGDDVEHNMFRISITCVWF